MGLKTLTTHITCLFLPISCASENMTESERESRRAHWASTKPLIHTHTHWVTELPDSWDNYRNHWPENPWGQVQYFAWEICWSYKKFLMFDTEFPSHCPPSSLYMQKQKEEEKKKEGEKNFSHFGRGWGFSKALHHASRLLDESQPQRSSTPPIHLLPTAGLSLPFPWALIPLLTTCQHCLSHSQEQHSLVLDESTSSTPPHPPTPHTPLLIHLLILLPFPKA